MWQVLPVQSQATRGLALSGAHDAFEVQGSMVRFNFVFNSQWFIILLRAATEQEKQ